MRDSGSEREEGGGGEKPGPALPGALRYVIADRTNRSDEKSPVSGGELSPVDIYSGIYHPERERGTRGSSGGSCIRCAYGGEVVGGEAEGQGDSVEDVR